MHLCSTFSLPMFFANEGFSILHHHLPPLLCPERTFILTPLCCNKKGGGPRVVVSTAAFHARVQGSVPGLRGLKET